MKVINGGVCAPKGYKANGIHCGIRDNKEKKDLSMIVSDVPGACAAVYTTNLVKGAPLTVTKEHLSDGRAQAIICNSGNANTCNANGIEIAEQMCELTGKALHIDKQNIVVASTGVIGQKLSIDPIAKGIPSLIDGLSSVGSKMAAEGIMTTDTVMKEIAIEFDLPSDNGMAPCHIGGIAKGSGMIHPNMATMLAFLTSDVAISPDMLQKSLSNDVKNTFNMISIDGDTSTNDMVVLLSNGLGKNKIIDCEGEAFDIFTKALHTINIALCRCIAADGEGASKLIECQVDGALNDDSAKKVAKSVVCSDLTKAAMFGADANWGRVLCAIGYSGADVDINKIDVSFTSSAGEVMVCQNGMGVDFSEELAKKILFEKEICIKISLNSGDACATAWGCDLTYDYVKINGDYRT